MFRDQTPIVLQRSPRSCMLNTMQFSVNLACCRIPVEDQKHSGAIVEHSNQQKRAEAGKFMHKHSRCLSSYPWAS